MRLLACAALLVASAAAAQQPGTAEQATLDAIQRIERLEPQVNAVIALDPDAANGANGADRPAPAPPAEDRYLLTALGRAGVGTVTELARVVLEHGGNFTDFSSRSADGALELLAEVALPAARDLGALQAALAAVAEGDPALTVRLQHQRLFAATNEIAFRRSGA